MDNQQIFEKLKTIVNSINAGAEINENTALVGQSILDSLEFMSYLIKVEESFHVRVPDIEVAKLKLGTICNMVNYLVDIA